MKDTSCHLPHFFPQGLRMNVNQGSRACSVSSGGRGQTRDLPIGREAVTVRAHNLVSDRAVTFNTRLAIPSRSSALPESIFEHASMTSVPVTAKSSSHPNETRSFSSTVKCENKIPMILATISRRRVSMRTNLLRVYSSLSCKACLKDPS